MATLRGERAHVRFRDLIPDRKGRKGRLCVFSRPGEAELALARPSSGVRALATGRVWEGGRGKECSEPTLLGGKSQRFGKSCLPYSQPPGSSRLFPA